MPQRSCFSHTRNKNAQLGLVFGRGSWTHSVFRVGVSEASRLLSRSCLFLLSFTSTMDVNGFFFELPLTPFDSIFTTKHGNFSPLLCCGLRMSLAFPPTDELLGFPGETFVSSFWPSRDDPPVHECSFDFLRVLGKPTVKVLSGMAVQFECVV